MIVSTPPHYLVAVVFEVYHRPRLPPPYRLRRLKSHHPSYPSLNQGRTIEYNEIDASRCDDLTYFQCEPRFTLLLELFDTAVVPNYYSLSRTASKE